MQHIRLALCGLTRFDSDIVRTLVEDISFVEVVSVVEPSGDLAADFVRSRADLIVSALPEHEMASQWRGALSRRRPLAALNIVDGHTRARLYALYPHRHTVAELNEETLFDALRHHLHALEESGVDTLGGD